MKLGQGDERGCTVRKATERGYAMAALLVGLSIMAVLMSMALPVWSQMARREKEEELIWRGQQYARAIGLFQRRYANTFPPTIDVLVEQRFLRKKYKDPMTNDDFQPIPAGGAAVVGGPPAAQGGTRIGATIGAGGQGQITVSRQGQPPVTTTFSGGAAGVRSAIQSVSGGMQSVQGIGIQGVVSKSTETSLKVYNGRTKYNEWAFVYLATTRAISAPQVPQGQGGRTPFGGPPPPPGSMTRPPAPNQPPFGPGGGMRGPGPMPGPGQRPFGPPAQPFGPPPQPFGAPGAPPPQRPPGR
jgi:type II secretory pathway pseudopilin PulG